MILRSISCDCPFRNQRVKKNLTSDDGIILAGRDSEGKVFQDFLTVDILKTNLNNYILFLYFSLREYDFKTYNAAMVFFVKISMTRFCQNFLTFL
jgi:hypothetical protein